MEVCLTLLTFIEQDRQEPISGPPPTVLLTNHMCCCVTSTACHRAMVECWSETTTKVKVPVKSLNSDGDCFRFKRKIWDEKSSLSRGSASWMSTASYKLQILVDQLIGMLFLRCWKNQKTLPASLGTCVVVDQWQRNIYSETYLQVASTKHIWNTFLIFANSTFGSTRFAVWLQGRVKKKKWHLPPIRCRIFHSREGALWSGSFKNDSSPAETSKDNVM